MDRPQSCSRRDALRLLGAVGAAPFAAMHIAKPGSAAADVVERNDAVVRTLLATQDTDSGSPWRGSVVDRFGLHTAGSAAGLIEAMASSFLHARSAFHGDDRLLARIGLAAGFLERGQSPQGNIDLLVTNFNSPPDTGFVVHHVATAAAIGRQLGADDLPRLLEPFLVKAAHGMATGGIHTPNHRWVVCSALAQVHALFPDDRYVRRIDQWLAEGIDIDADGQFLERSTLTYNVVSDRALVVTAAKLGRPELLDPVRRNLRALTWLLHADGEVVTEISRRQDQYARGTVSGYWFPLTYMAVRDGDGQFSALARTAAVDGERLSALLEYPELASPLPPAAPLPDDFEKTFHDLAITRIRRGLTSATLLLGGCSRLFTLRHGSAVVEGVRMASAFFGKGQFVPDSAEKRDGTWHYRQVLEAPYYQPLAEPVAPQMWAEARARRRQTEVCRLEQTAAISETEHGFEVRLTATGTSGVPVAVEIGLREGGELLGCRALPGEDGVHVLEEGTAVYRAGDQRIRFGKGVAPHIYTEVRGAEPRLSKVSVYVTGFTPFDHTLVFDCA